MHVTHSLDLINFLSRAECCSKISLRFDNNNKSQTLVRASRAKISDFAHAPVNSSITCLCITVTVMWDHAKDQVNVRHSFDS